MKNLLLCVLSIGGLAIQLTRAAICEHYGKQCSKDAPCCNLGYCDAKVRFCNDGCDPSKSYKSSNCNPTPYCVDFEESFDNPKIDHIDDFSGNPNDADFTSDFTPSNYEVKNGKLILYMTYDEKTKAGYGATISTTRAIQYGKMTAVFKTGTTEPGIVSSFITRNSLNGDEVDFEFVGGNKRAVEENYYYRAVTGEIDYTQGVVTPVPFDHTSEFHSYTIEWMPDYMTWHVDGKPVRTVYKKDTFDEASQVYRFPDTPSRISFSIWDASASGAKGTIEWAGGRPDWSDKNKRFELEVDSLKVECFFKGNDTVEWISNTDKKSKSLSSGDKSNGDYEDEEDEELTFAENNNKNGSITYVPSFAFGSLMSIISFYALKP